MHNVNLARHERGLKPARTAERNHLAPVGPPLGGAGGGPGDFQRS